VQNCTSISEKKRMLLSISKLQASYIRVVACISYATCKEERTTFLYAGNEHLFILYFLQQEKIWLALNVQKAAITFIDGITFT